MPRARVARATTAPDRVVVESLERRALLAVASAFPLINGSATGFDSAQKAVTDSAGDVYVTGLFSGSVNFDPAGSKAGQLSASGDTDVYIAKYSAAGALDWVQQIGGDYTNKLMQKFKKRDVAINAGRVGTFVGAISSQPRLAGEYVNDIALDAAGDAYLVGSFRGTIQLGKQTLQADERFGTSYYDALIVKVSSSGQFSWSRQISGHFDDDALSVAVDAAGAPVVGGYYQRQADFNVGGKAYELTGNGRDAGFIARYTASGALAWTWQVISKDLGANERNSVNAVAITPRGEVYAGGTFAYKADFDPSGSDYVLKSDGLTDAFLIRLNRKGHFNWALATGGNGYDGNSAIALGNDGSIYTGGYFADDVDVNPLPNVQNIFTADQGSGVNNSLYTDLVISKFAINGTPVWQDQISGPYFETISGITVAPNGGIYTSGSFFNTVDFASGKGSAVLSSTKTNDGSIKDSNTNFGRNESYDWFVQELTPAGKFVAAKQFGGADDDYSSGISVTNTGQLLVAGRYVKAVGALEDRQEQLLVYLLGVDLSIL